MICFVCETAYGKISWEISNYGIKNISMIYRWLLNTGNCMGRVNCTCTCTRTYSFSHV
jgi:hypothetical protein